MPPINQQGSRAGLVTALVVFVILFVISSVFAFQFYGKFKDKDQSYEDFKKTYKDYVSLPSPGAAQQGPLADLLTARTDLQGKYDIAANDTAMDVAIKETSALQKTVQGSAAGSPAATADHAVVTIKDAQSVLSKSGVGVTLPTTGLEGAVSALAATAADKQRIIADLTAKLRDAKASQTAALADTAKVSAQKDDDLKKQQASAAADLASAQAAASKNDAAMSQMQTDQKASGDKVVADSQQTASELNTANQQIAKLTAEINTYKAKMASRRADVINPIIRQADAKIVRVPNNEVCYINLGFGDQVTPGLTFEVYDKTEGVPPIPDNVTGDEQLPVGKASIEITHVGTTSSECRIVKLAPGAILGEGDVIGNLIYDPHTKYNFFVYGNFDLAGNGRPNAPDADVIKRLVTQWGGKLTDQVNVDTDFVVLGSEPVLPNFSKDDLTAENQDKLAKAQDALNKYQELATQAKELHIPIMNQNRFLYYVGFYDQARR